MAANRRDSDFLTSYNAIKKSFEMAESDHSDEICWSSDSDQKVTKNQSAVRTSKVCNCFHGSKSRKKTNINVRKTWRPRNRAKKKNKKLIRDECKLDITISDARKVFKKRTTGCTSPILTSTERFPKKQREYQDKEKIQSIYHTPEKYRPNSSNDCNNNSGGSASPILTSTFLKSKKMFNKSPKTIDTVKDFHCTPMKRCVNISPDMFQDASPIFGESIKLTEEETFPAAQGERSSMFNNLAKPFSPAPTAKEDKDNAENENCSPILKFQSRCLPFVKRVSHHSITDRVQVHRVPLDPVRNVKKKLFPEIIDGCKELKNIGQSPFSVLLSKKETHLDSISNAVVKTNSCGIPAFKPCLITEKFPIVSTCNERQVNCAKMVAKVVEKKLLPGRTESHLDPFGEITELKSLRKNLPSIGTYEDSNFNMVPKQCAKVSSSVENNEIAIIGIKERYMDLFDEIDESPMSRFKKFLATKNIPDDMLCRLVEIRAKIDVNIGKRLFPEIEEKYLDLFDATYEKMPPSPVSRYEGFPFPVISQGSVSDAEESDVDSVEMENYMKKLIPEIQEKHRDLFDEIPQSPIAILAHMTKMKSFSSQSFLFDAIVNNTPSEKEVESPIRISCFPSSSKSDSDTQISSGIPIIKRKVCFKEKTVVDSYDSPIKKKRKLANTSIAGRLQRLLQRQKSLVNIWKHEIDLAEHSNFVMPAENNEGAMLFSVLQAYEEYGKFLIYCRKIEKNNGSDNDCYTLIINEYFIKNLDVNIGCKIKLLKPYTIIEVKNGHGNNSEVQKVVLNVCRLLVYD